MLSSVRCALWLRTSLHRQLQQASFSCSHQTFIFLVDFMAVTNCRFAAVLSGKGSGFHGMTEVWPDHRSLANIHYTSCTYYYGKCCRIDSWGVAETVRHLIDPCNSQAVIPLGPVAQTAPASCVLNPPGYASMLFYRSGPAPTFVLFHRPVDEEGAFGGCSYALETVRMLVQCRS